MRKNAFGSFQVLVMVLAVFLFLIAVIRGCDDTAERKRLAEEAARGGHPYPAATWR
jgi:hypothetical protein